MYVSRMTFHVRPGKTADVEANLRDLAALVAKAGGGRTRILRAHFASLGAPDIVFEQEVNDLAALESQIRDVTATDEFQRWSHMMSELLAESPKRELYQTDA